MAKLMAAECQDTACVFFPYQFNRISLIKVEDQRTSDETKKEPRNTHC